VKIQTKKNRLKNETVFQMIFKENKYYFFSSLAQQAFFFPFLHSFLDSHFFSSPSFWQQAFLQSFLQASFSWSQQFSVHVHLSPFTSDANKEVEEAAIKATMDKVRAIFFITLNN